MEKNKYSSHIISVYILIYDINYIIPYLTNKALIIRYKFESAKFSLYKVDFFVCRGGYTPSCKISMLFNMVLSISLIIG